MTLARALQGCSLLVLFMASTRTLFAQGTPPAPLVLKGVTVSGSVRARLESWNWFGDAANGEYAYPASLFRIGLGHAGRQYDWQIELAAPVLLNLPEQPVGAGPAGAG